MQRHSKKRSQIKVWGHNQKPYMLLNQRVWLLRWNIRYAAFYACFYKANASNGLSVFWWMLRQQRSCIKSCIFLTL